MDFYLGKSIENFNINDTNVELSDDLLEFLYKNRNIFGDEEFLLQKIDPYADTVIENSELQDWLAMFNSIVASNVLNEYEDLGEIGNINKIVLIINEALCKHLNLIIVGD